MTTAAQIAEWEAELDAIQLLESPATFAQVISRQDSEQWYPYKHLLYVNKLLVDLSEGRIKRLMITLPPRHGKSLLCSLYLPVWYLNRYPDRRIILTSYGDDYAAEWGRRCRDLLTNHEDMLRIQINKKSTAADRWDIERAAGGMKTAGVGGQITGRGANLFIIDDPVKSAEEANSATLRDKAWEWWQRTASTRLQPVTAKGKRIQDPSLLLIQTRWHEDDLAGRFLLDDREKGEWTVINLPALAEENDLMSRTPGQALCPELFNENALGAQREVMGAAGFAALYQQRPQPEGGGAFKRETFQYWTQHGDEGFTYRLEDKTEGAILVPQADCWRFITADLAVRAKETSDYTVVGIWDVAPWLEPSRLILRELIRVRVEGAEHVDLLKRLYDLWKPRFVGVEEAMQGTQTMDFLRRQNVPVYPLRHKSKDKAFRAKDAQLLLENRRVYFPKRATWLGEFEHELLLFPSGTYDDQVDVLAYAAQEVLRGINLSKKPKEDDPTTLSDRVWAQLRNRQKSSQNHPTLGRM